MRKTLLILVIPLFPLIGCKTDNINPFIKPKISNNISSESWNSVFNIMLDEYNCLINIEIVFRDELLYMKGDLDYYIDNDSIGSISLPFLHGFLVWHDEIPSIKLTRADDPPLNPSEPIELLVRNYNSEGGIYGVGIITLDLQDYVFPSYLEKFAIETDPNGKLTSPILSVIRDNADQFNDIQFDRAAI